MCGEGRVPEPGLIAQDLFGGCLDSMAFPFPAYPGGNTMSVALSVIIWLLVTWSFSDPVSGKAGIMSAFLQVVRLLFMRLRPEVTFELSQYQHLSGGDALLVPGGLFDP